MRIIIQAIEKDLLCLHSGRNCIWDRETDCFAIGKSDAMRLGFRMKKMENREAECFAIELVDEENYFADRNQRELKVLSSILKLIGGTMMV